MGSKRLRWMFIYQDSTALARLRIPWTLPTLVLVPACSLSYNVKCLQTKNNFLCYESGWLIPTFPRRTQLLWIWKSLLVKTIFFTCGGISLDLTTDAVCVIAVFFAWYFISVLDCKWKSMPLSLALTTALCKNLEMNNLATRSIHLRCKRRSS